MGGMDFDGVESGIAGADRSGREDIGELLAHCGLQRPPTS